LTKNGNGTWILSGTVLHRRHDHQGGTIKLGHGFGTGKSGSYGGQMTSGRTFDLNGQQNYANVTSRAHRRSGLRRHGDARGQAGGAPQIVDTAATPLGIAFAAGTALTMTQPESGMATCQPGGAKRNTAVGTRTINIGDSSPRPSRWTSPAAGAIRRL